MLHRRLQCFQFGQFPFFNQLVSRLINDLARLNGLVYIIELPTKSEELEESPIHSRAPNLTNI